MHNGEESRNRASPVRQVVMTAYQNSRYEGGRLSALGRSHHVMTELSSSADRPRASEKTTYPSSHHFVMSVPKKNLINKQQQEPHPYRTQEDTVLKKSANIIRGKSQLSQATLSRVLHAQARSTSRSFFNRRPKTVQQLLELNQQSSQEEIQLG